jgi:two-component system LytT family sensor kinase
VERVRFSDRLRVHIDAGTDVEDAMVPALILQPLVENALRHGIGRRAAAGRIDISACAYRGRLRLEVFDDGPGPPSTAVDGGDAGIGLSNTRARLAALYGEDASCTLDRAEGGGTRARVELPLRIAAPDAHV